MLSAFLIKLFNMSIAAGFVVLAVVLARLVLKRAPKWLRCALWVLVAVRLIIPTLPQSPVSLVPSAETIVIKQTEQSAGPEQSGSTDVQQDPEPFDMPYTSPSETQTIEIHSGIPFINSWAGDEFIKDSSSPAEADPGKKVSFLDVAGYLWLGGLIVMVCYAVVSFARLRAKVRASVPRDNSVYVCDDIDSPFILGVVRPRIYLPSGLSADAEAHVLAHERAHLSRRDQLWKPIGYLLLSVYWFNPLMWLAYVLFCRDIEFACDEKVVGSLNETDRADYSRALLSCSVSRRAIAACPLAFGEVGVKDRVKSALNYKKPAFWVIIAAVVICLVLAVCFLTNPRDKAMQGKVTKWFEDEQYAAGQGRVITLPEYPGVEFREEGHIYMVKDGKEEVVVHAAFIIKNAYFCDLNGDGKPELCTTCEIGSGLIDKRVVVYCPADGSTLELQDRGNFDYMLDERDGKLIVMKRAYERTSSVGEDGLLAMKDGKLIMTALSDGSGKSPTSPPDPETDPEPAVRQYINIDSHHYYRQDNYTKDLPLGYNFSGSLVAAQTNDTEIVGSPYFTGNGLTPAIYVYMPVTICRESSWNGMTSYIMTQEYCYIPWIMGTDEGQTSGTRSMTMTDVIRLASTRGTNLAWSNLEDYFSIMPYSGRYCRHYFITGSDFSLRVEGTPPQIDGTDGSVTRAELVHQGTFEFIDIRTGDVEAFIKKYSTKSGSQPFHSEYIRDNGLFSFYRDGKFRSYEDIRLIDSYDEYKSHLRAPADLIPVAREGTTITTDVLIARYTEEWFADHQLIVASLLEGSGSTRLKVVDLKQSGSTLTVDIDRLCPEAFTTDMASWQILIEIDRSLPEDIKLELTVGPGGSESGNTSVEPLVVQSLVIDTYAQGENLHHITNRASIETAYGIYSMYVEGSACQKESPDIMKQLLTLTFTMTDGTEQAADFYQANSGNYYMDKKYKGYSAIEKTVSIPEKAFDMINELLNTKISEAETKLFNHVAASEQVRKALMDDWAEWTKKSEDERLYSNKMPGVCWEYFSTWEEATAYLGAEPWNPLETADWLEKKNYAGADIGTGSHPGDVSGEGFMHAYLYWEGSVDGDISYYMLQSGYAHGGDRIVIQISSDVQSMEELKRTDRSTDKYYAIDMEFPRDGLQYKVTVSSFDGAESCKATSAKILNLLFPGSNSHIE